MTVVTIATGRVTSLPSAHVGNGTVSITYSKKYYRDARISALPKKLRDGEGGPPFQVGPARYAIELAPRRESQRFSGRYYYPSYSVIYVTPLHDKTVAAFEKAYPNLSGNTQLLRELLREAPRDLYSWVEKRSTQQTPWDVPDEPFRNAAAFLLAKFRVVTPEWGEGCRFLTYYRNGKAGYGATNAELFYSFQGITKSGDFYVSARLAIRNDRLPDSIDDPRANSDETEQEQRREHDRIDSWADESFFPRLNDLDAMMQAVEIKH